MQRLDEQAYVYHQIRYNYTPQTNRLESIQAYGINETTYEYDAVGNLVYDESEKMNIDWNASGKLRTVNKGNGYRLSFRYSPMGHRQIKRRDYRGAISTTVQYYLHDPGGNIISIYETGSNSVGLYLKEQSIYGSGRIGIIPNSIRILPEITETEPQPSEKFTRQIGQRRYELADHLGNVQVTLSDRKQEKGVINGLMTYTPEIFSSTDYYPYGLPMPERTFQAGNYRYGFNGQEKDNEVYGEGSAYDFGERIYDSRIGKWLSVDPLADKYPYQSPYVYCGNNPLNIIDPWGLDEWELAKDGTLTKRENGRTDIDIVHGTNRDGENVSREFKLGTIKEMSQGTGKENTGDGDQNFNYNYLDIKGDNAGTQFFEFAAQNTDVEWAHIQTGIDDNRIGTTGREANDPAGGNMVKDFFNKGINIRNDVHSHPDKTYINPNPSGGDFNYAGWAQDRYGTKSPPTSVYSKQNGKWVYTPYNRFGIIK